MPDVVTSPPPPPPPPPPSPPVSPPAPPPPPADQKFFSAWPDDVKAHVEKAGYPDALAIAKSDMNLQKLTGVPASELIRKPVQGFDIDPKPHLAALQVLGAPADAAAAAKAYEPAFVPVGGLGEMRAEVKTAAAKAFEEVGILPFQAKRLMQVVADIQKADTGAAGAVSAAAVADRQARLDAFKAERGAKFDADVAGAKSIIRNFDRPLTGDIEALKAKGYVREDGKPKGEFEAWLDETGQASDPRAIAILARVAERFGNSGLPGEPGRTGDNAGALSKAQAEQQLAKLEGDPGWRKQLLDSNDPNHKAVVAQRMALIEAMSA